LILFPHFLVHLRTGAPAPPFSCRAGLLADEAVELLRRFYVSGNPKAPRPHRPAAS